MRCVNRLADTGSDYLLQHAHQSVDWWPWCDEALATAKELNRPILLSVGYASCHWCHVMSQESFDDPDIAEYINEHFVAIKVDRQQHPDVDALYMTATQAMNNGAGGWPMTAFLTPDGKPFFTGTYFPLEASDGRPSFKDVLEAMAGLWATRRDDVETSAAAIVEQLSHPEHHSVSQPPEITGLIEAIQSEFDVVHAGFGTAPKFPPGTLIEALLIKGDPQGLDMAQRTLEAMARGGIHDQVGGGFHRYSVDAGWVVPHFEKMLYDNAVLLNTYVLGWRRTADHDASLRLLFERTAHRIVSWVAREMRNEQGGFISALDADSCDIRGAVHEGIYYLWNLELLADALGAPDADWAATVFHVTTVGTFVNGLSTLQLRNRPDFVRLNQICETLLAERARRFRPGSDRMVVAGWNGLMISALIEGAMVFNQPLWLELARKAAAYLREVHLVEGSLRRCSIDGLIGQGPGMAEDYGFVAEAFAKLAGATGDASWLHIAADLLDTACTLFDHSDGGFYDTPASGLYDRSRALTDHVTPAGTSALIAALRIVGLLSERDELTQRAERAARTTWTTISQHPRFAGSALRDLLISDDARRGLGRAVAVVVDDEPMGELARATYRMAPPGTAIIVARPGTTGFGSWLEGRDEPGAYVCRGTVCFEPVRHYADLKTPLWRRA